MEASIRQRSATRSTRDAGARADQGGASRDRGGLRLRRPGVGPRHAAAVSVSTFDQDRSDGVPQIDTVTIGGPYKPTGPGDTPSRRRDLHLPAGSAHGGGRRPRAPRQIVTTLARRAYRRPVTDGRRSASRSSSSTDRPARDSGLRRGIELGLQRMLAEPEFVFRVEREPARRGARGGPTASATSSWRRGCRSSCGAASPTTSC